MCPRVDPQFAFFSELGPLNPTQVRWLRPFSPPNSGCRDLRESSHTSKECPWLVLSLLQRSTVQCHSVIIFQTCARNSVNQSSTPCLIRWQRDFCIWAVILQLWHFLHFEIAFIYSLPFSLLAICNIKKEIFLQTLPPFFSFCSSWRALGPPVRSFCILKLQRRWRDWK